MCLILVMQQQNKSFNYLGWFWYLIKKEDSKMKEIKEYMEELEVIENELLLQTIRNYFGGKIA